MDDVATRAAAMVEAAMAGNSAPVLYSAGRFAAGYEAPAYLIQGIAQRKRLYSCTALTGAGKTAVSLTAAVHVAMGAQLAGREVERGRVAFFAGENPDDIRARLIVTAEAFGAEPETLPLYFFDRTFDITEMYGHIAACIEEIGGVDLVVIDTAASFFQGDDENSNTELGNYARDLRRLCELKGGPCVIVNAHPTKTPSKHSLYPRGGSAFLNEVDGNLRLWSDDEGVTELHWCGKFRGPDFDPMSFKLEERRSDKVQDSKGRSIPSVVAVPVGEAEQALLSKSARSDEDAVLDVMLNYPNGSMASWCQNLGWIGSTDEPQKSKIARIVKRLQEDGLATMKRKKWVLTKTGKQEAERVLGI